MNKKYLIITIAACALCLGIGVVIGMGISQNNLTATGANQTKVTDESETLPTAEDFAVMEPAELKKALRDYSDELLLLEERNESAKNIMTEIDGLRDMYHWVVTGDLYKNLCFLSKALDDEMFRFRCSMYFRGLRGYSYFFKPGTSLPYEDFVSLGEEVLYARVSICEATDDYQKGIDDIKKALSDKGVTY